MKYRWYHELQYQVAKCIGRICIRLSNWFIKNTDRCIAVMEKMYERQKVAEGIEDAEDDRDCADHPADRSMDPMDDVKFVLFKNGNT